MASKTKAATFTWHLDYFSVGSSTVTASCIATTCSSASSFTSIVGQEPSIIIDTSQTWDRG
jgi:hypothetical protein